MTRSSEPKRAIIPTRLLNTLVDVGPVDVGPICEMYEGSFLKNTMKWGVALKIFWPVPLTSNKRPAPQKNQFVLSS